MHPAAMKTSVGVLSKALHTTTSLPVRRATSAATALTAASPGLAAVTPAVPLTSSAPAPPADDCPHGACSSRPVAFAFASGLLGLATPLSSAAAALTDGGGGVPVASAAASSTALQSGSWLESPAAEILATLTATPSIQVLGLEAAGAAALLAATWAYRARPRGWARTDVLDIRPSPVAGMGLFATRDIPQGTVLGAYPGRPRNPAGMAAKAAVAPGAREYTFCTDRGLYLDPTDAQGSGPSAFPAPGPWWPWPVCIALAYANEPPPGSAGVNCVVKDGADEAELLFVADRDLVAGEEVFIDYGTTYIRSNYR